MDPDDKTLHAAVRGCVLPFRQGRAMADDDTIAWYDRFAPEYAEQTADLDVGAEHRMFLEHVRPGGAVLDAGCGGGRDAAAFMRTGRPVVAYDASATMARVAAERTGLAVAVRSHLDVDEVCAYDGIWCYASLLHVPADRWEDVLPRFARALKPGGALALSVKDGAGEWRDKDSRYFAAVPAVPPRRSRRPGFGVPGRRSADRRCRPLHALGSADRPTPPLTAMRLQPPSGAVSGQAYGAASGPAAPCACLGRGGGLFPPRDPGRLTGSAGRR